MGILFSPSRGRAVSYVRERTQTRTENRRARQELVARCNVHNESSAVHPLPTGRSSAALQSCDTPFSLFDSDSEFVELMF